VIIIVIVIASIALHLAFAAQLPVSNDEGSYIQDVVQADPSFLPFRDYLTKGPLFLAALKVWQIVAQPENMLQWRYFSALTWAAVVAAFWLLAAEINFSRRAQVISTALMALPAGAVVLTSYVVLQPLSILLSLMGFWLALRSLRRNEPLGLTLGAFIIAAAYFVRASSIVSVLAAGLAIFLYYRGGTFCVRIGYRTSCRAL
jgi:dolichyl-phosphate-mannose--protein O-mannosyl transferase